jgi:hypothetical protein
VKLLQDYSSDGYFVVRTVVVLCCATGGRARSAVAGRLEYPALAAGSREP